MPSSILDVAGTALQSGQSFALSIDGHQRPDFAVTAVSGREAISELYAFDIRFTAEEWLRPSEVVGRDASVTITLGEQSFTASGLVLELHCDDPTHNNLIPYRITLGPRFALTDLSRENRAYVSAGEGVTVSDLIDAKLREGGVVYEKRIQQSGYPRRDYVAQYGESDFAFLSRTCEHHGVFYFFESVGKSAMLVFGDSNNAFREAEAPRLPFGPTRGPLGDATVSSLRETSRVVTGRVETRDYDDMLAAPIVAARAEVRGDGWGTFGTAVEYGPNLATGAGVTDLDLGRWFARIRAQEIESRRTTYQGVSSSMDLRPGRYFRLTGHPNPFFRNRPYLVTAVEHRAGATPDNAGPYENRFTAIMLDAALAEPTFRPERKTPRPPMGGLFNATVESSERSPKSADIDEHGRYRLRQAFDQERSAPGHASAPVRQAQPFVGKDGTGFKMPLLPETSVVVAHINGDPDRPVIVGAIANAANPSLVSRDNRDLHRIRTSSGGLFEIRSANEG